MTKNCVRHGPQQYCSLNWILFDHIDIDKNDMKVNMLCVCILKGKLFFSMKSIIKAYWAEPPQQNSTINIHTKNRFRTLFVLP